MTEDPANALEQSRPVCQGHKGVAINLCMKRKIFYVMSAEQHSRLNVTKQQLEGKLKLLNDMDKDILQLCKVDTIEGEIEESENVIASIINCNQQLLTHSLDYSSCHSPNSGVT